MFRLREMQICWTVDMEPLIWNLIFMSRPPLIICYIFAILKYVYKHI